MAVIEDIVGLSSSFSSRVPATCASSPTTTKSISRSERNSCIDVVHQRVDAFILVIVECSGREMDVNLQLTELAAWNVRSCHSSNEPDLASGV